MRGEQEEGDEGGEAPEGPGVARRRHRQRRLEWSPPQVSSLVPDSSETSWGILAYLAWLVLHPQPSPLRHGALAPHLPPSEVLASAGFSMEECEAARHVIFEGLDVEPDNS